MKNLLFLLLVCSVGSIDHNRSNAVWPGQLIVEPTTLHCAGFEWEIAGDENRNSSVRVQYRKKGDGEWSEGHPLLRIGGEKIYGHGQRWLYTTPHMFAGSIFGLEEDTEYECRFEMLDPDGIKGKAAETVLIKTRQEPKPWPHGNVYHVYPPGYGGPKMEPAFTEVRPRTDPNPPLRGFSVNEVDEPKVLLPFAC